MYSMFGKLRARAEALLFSVVFLSAGSYSSAQQAIPFTETHTVATATQAVPLEYTLNVTTADTYTVTLTDLGALLTPASAPLASVELGITGGKKVVGSPMTSAGTGSYTLGIGTYVIHVLGQPGPVPGSGPVGVQVNDSHGHTILTSSDTLALPSTPVAGSVGLVDAHFTVTTEGDYTVSLNDLQLPATVGSLTLLLIPNGGAQPAALLPDPNTAAMQQTVHLTQGDYRIFAAGSADVAAGAGLYTVTVAPSGGGSPTFAQAEPVGSMQFIGSTQLAAGTYNVTVTDLALPGVLSQVGAAVINSQNQAVTTGTAAQSFTAAAADTYQVYGFGTLANGNNAGSFAIGVRATGAAPSLNLARVVTAAGGPVLAYSYDITLGSGGTYSVDLADFKVPAALTALNAGVIQGGALVGSSLSGAGTKSLTLSAGSATLLVFAQPASGGGLFGADLTASGASSPVFETTQCVGPAFTARKLAVTAGGNYGVAVSDVVFPVGLRSFSVIVTRGINTIGSISGGGQFNFTATTGNYFLNFVAQPDTTVNAGTYFIDVESAPTVTLNSDHQQVNAGDTVNLTWTTQNATSCTASGGAGFSGTQATSGSLASSKLIAAVTFTLTCTNTNGFTGSSSVTVNVSSVPADGGKSGGGGGSVSVGLLVWLAGMLALQLAGSYRRRHV